MKKRILGASMALGLIVSSTLPALPTMAATQTVGTVTVPSYINFTVTDNGATSGLTWGSLNPGTTNNAESEQGVNGAVTLTVSADTNSNLNIQTKGDDFAISKTSGTATGGSTTTLVDAGAAFTTTAAVGDIIVNRTTGATGTVTAVTSATTLTASGGFSGGSRATFASGDLYAVKAASPAQTIAITNAKWDTDSNVTGATAMSSSYATVGSSTAGSATTVELYHWISIPSGKAPGTYTSVFYYQAA